MKTLLYSIVILMLSFKASAQNYINRDTVVTLVSERLISLNGGLRASAGGKSRTIVPINLPQGTKSWYYSFSTSSSGSGTKNLQLGLQIASAMSDPSHLSSTILSKVTIPSGSHTIDVYLMDAQNATNFEEKVDLSGGTYQFFPNGTVTATRQASVSINFTSNNFYLGIKNPSTLDGVDITLEVVAIVSNQIYEDSWVALSLESINNKCLESFAINNQSIESICQCLKSKITSQYTPSSYSALTNLDKEQVYKTQIANCSKETGNENVLNNDKRIRELSEQYRGQAITKDYEAQENTLKELISLGITDAMTYNSLGFCQLCLKKLDDAKKNLQIGLGKNPNELFLIGNLGNYYLLTGSYDQAFEIYKEHKNKKLANKKKFKDAVSEDLKEFQRLGIGKMEDIVRIKKDLKID